MKHLNFLPGKTESPLFHFANRRHLAFFFFFFNSKSYANCKLFNITCLMQIIRIYELHKSRIKERERPKEQAERWESGRVDMTNPKHVSFYKMLYFSFQKYYNTRERMCVCECVFLPWQNQMQTKWKVEFEFWVSTVKWCLNFFFLRLFFSFANMFCRSKIEFVWNL